MELITPRLIVRSMHEADKQLYCDLYCDPETMRHIGAPWTRAEAERAFRNVLKATRAAPPRTLFLTLIRKDTQQPIGLCTLQNFDRPRRQAEFGVMVVSSGRTQGFASEAMIGVIAHAFAELSVDEVWVRVAVDHAVCERLVIGVGLVPHSGVLPEDRAANVRRWSAYRNSWLPTAAFSA
jgi:RimJ/RimL family protein N-acetyltransferase